MNITSGLWMFSCLVPLGPCILSTRFIWNLNQKNSVQRKRAAQPRYRDGYDYAEHHVDTHVMDGVVDGA
jgi:hypothetical protein